MSCKPTYPSCRTFVSSSPATSARARARHRVTGITRAHVQGRHRTDRAAAAAGVLSGAAADAHAPARRACCSSPARASGRRPRASQAGAHARTGELRPAGGRARRPARPAGGRARSLPRDGVTVTAPHARRARRTAHRAARAPGGVGGRDRTADRPPEPRPSGAPARSHAATGPCSYGAIESCSHAASEPQVGTALSFESTLDESSSSWDGAGRPGRRTRASRVRPGRRRPPGGHLRHRLRLAPDDGRDPARPPGPEYPRRRPGPRGRRHRLPGRVLRPRGRVRGGEAGRRPRLCDGR